MSSKKQKESESPKAQKGKRKMLNRVWAHPEDKNTWKTKVEEHVYRDRVTEEEVFDYSFRDRFGRTFNVKDWDEAQNLIKHYNLVDVTEAMVKAGWISRTQYEAFKKRMNNAE